MISLSFGAMAGITMDFVSKTYSLHKINVIIHILEQFGSSIGRFHVNRNCRGKGNISSCIKLE